MQDQLIRLLPTSLIEAVPRIVYTGQRKLNGGTRRGAPRPEMGFGGLFFGPLEEEVDQ